MPIINLISEQRAATQKAEQRARIAFMTMVGSATVGLFGYGFVFYMHQALQMEIDRKQADVKRLAPLVSQIEGTERQTGQLQPRLTILTDAQTKTDRWDHILLHFETQTPPGTWLTGLQCMPSNDPSKPVLMTFTGTAGALDPIGEFVMRTQNEPNLNSVVLHFAQEKRSSQGSRAIDFEVGAELAGSSEKKVQEDDKKI